MKKTLYILFFITIFSTFCSFSINEINMDQEDTSTKKVSNMTLKKREAKLKKEIKRLNEEKGKTDKIVNQLRVLQKELGKITSSLRTMRRKL